MCSVGKQFGSFEEFDNALKTLHEKFATLYVSTTAKLFRKRMKGGLQQGIFELCCEVVYTLVKHNREARKKDQISNTSPQDVMLPLLLHMIGLRINLLFAIVSCSIIIIWEKRC